MELIGIEPILYEEGFDRVNGNEHFIFGVETMQEWMRAQPVVDAVPVVRCKDCKYRDGTPGQPNILCGQMHDDDFCSYGERTEIKMTDYERGYQRAMEDINRPMCVVVPQWNPSSCPCCHKSFDAYEPCNGGQYKRAITMERCPFCGQRLAWKFR